MKKALQNLFVILLAFISLSFVGCKNSEATKAITNQSPTAVVENTPVEATPKEAIKNETSEEKAVRLAEEHISKNGYTNAPPDENSLSHETVEFAESEEALLSQRHNSLEPKAYGILYGGRLGDDKGWTVVFSYKKEYLGKEYLKELKRKKIEIGRCVTMDENFENLLVEHKDFPLENVDKKLQ